MFQRLRSDTTAVYWSLNNPFRKGEKHGFPVTVNFLKSAICKLRAVEAKGGKGHDATVDLWRGMHNLDFSSNFSSEGVC